MFLYFPNPPMKLQTLPSCPSGKVTDIIMNFQSGRCNHTLTTSKLQKSRVFFEVRLNPFDEEDNNILKTLDNLKESTKYPISQFGHKIKLQLDEFQGRIALLLKHDWERSKTEVSNKWKIIFILFSLIFTLFCFFIAKQHNFCYDYQPYDLTSLLIYIVEKKYIFYVIAGIIDFAALYYSAQLIIKLTLLKPRIIKSKHCYFFFNLLKIPCRVDYTFWKDNHGKENKDQNSPK